MNQSSEMSTAFGRPDRQMFVFHFVLVIVRILERTTYCKERIKHDTDWLHALMLIVVAILIL